MMKQEFKLFSQIKNAYRTYHSRADNNEAIYSVIPQTDKTEEDEITETLGSTLPPNRFREGEPVRIQPLKEIIYIHTDEII